MITGSWEQEPSFLYISMSTTTEEPKTYSSDRAGLMEAARDLTEREAESAETAAP